MASANFLAREKATSAPLMPAEQVAFERIIAKLREQIAGLEAKYKHSLAENHALHEQVSFIEAFGEARDPSAWERDKKKDGHQYCAIACASDWHLGEVVDPATVGGLNTFNEAIALKRVKKFFTKIPEYCERYAPAAKVLYLWAGGDFISGEIHEELREHGTHTATEACLWFRELWSDGLATLLKEMPGRRIIVPTSMGNHGRNTIKPRASTAASHSYEQMTYRMLARDWRKESRVEWRISEGYHNVLEAFGRKIRWHHGDAIRFWGGVGGLTIPVRKAIAQWNKSETVDLDICGHLHEWHDLNDAIVNGSLVGFSSFSVIIKASYQPPIQGFLVFDRKHGLRQSTKIFVDD